MNRNIDIEKLVSRADIRIDGPVKRSESGLPVGNGVMGSLVWTSPKSLKFQINRSDVFANNCETNSFPERCTDYAYTCGYVDIDFPSFDDDVFTEDALTQHLSVYDALVTMKAKEIECRVLTWHCNDVIMVQIEDRRERPAETVVRLRMMRPPSVATRNHTAESSFEEHEKEIVLSQEFKEGDFVCSSALAVDVAGRAYRVVQRSETELALMLDPAKGAGTYTIIIGSASAFAEKSESLAKAGTEMEKAREAGFSTVYGQNRKWWSGYWSKGYIKLDSADGKAEAVQQHYTYYFYLLASCSRRGDYAPNYGGLIWSTRGDMRAWGAQYWWINMNHYYNGLFPANRAEVLDPYFNMYRNMHDSLETAARQQWGSKGVYIPETSWFDGLEELPEEIAEEMRDLYLFNRPWETRSDAFKKYAHYKHPQNARWNWKSYGRYVEGRWEYDERGHGPIGRVLHLFESGCELAYQYWLRYEYSQDKQWLAETGYPMIKGLAEFYRNYPNFKKDGDGIYHIYLVNDQETVWGATDTLGLMTSMKLLFPAAVKASETLEIDEELRDCWQEVSDNLAPLPVSTHPMAMEKGEEGEKPFWVRGLKPADHEGRGYETRTFPSTGDLCTLETKEADPEMFDISLNSFKRHFPKGFGYDPPLFSRSHATRSAAHLGLSEEFKNAVYNQAVFNVPKRAPHANDKLYKYGEDLVVLENRMALVEGFNAIEAQRLGIVSGALHDALMQDSPGKPGMDPVIRLFPAWPVEWDADFQLLARGGFLVSSSIKSCKIESIEVVSQYGGTCRIRNPWKGERISIYINGDAVSETEGDLITIETEKNDTIEIKKIEE